MVYAYEKLLNDCGHERREYLVFGVYNIRPNWTYFINETIVLRFWSGKVR